MSALLPLLAWLSASAGPAQDLDAAALAAQLHAPAPPRVVDLRSPAVYAASHIPGASQSSAWALTRSGALRRQQLVLVDAGLPGGPADTLAAQLAAQGVRVQALRGGYRAWCEAGLPSSAPCGRVDVVSPSEVAGRELVSEDEVPARLAQRGPAGSQALADAPIVAVAEGTALPKARPGVFWVDGGAEAARAALAPARLGSRALIGVAKPSGSPITTDAASCGCKR